ncbi:MAG: hypothetical protein KJ893_00070 [Candidatus Omnitrophica bacterium]|nr:hypothetical protein [Candidatus Omnitrophota bacterium]
MNTNELIEAVHKIIEVLNNNVPGGYTQACEFLRNYAGPKNSFLEQIKQYNPKAYSAEYVCKSVKPILESFIQYLESGFHQGISPERKAQLDVVSDFLEQAQILLQEAKVHPAAPAILIGATLEEFLRTWVETEGLSLGNKKPSIDAYAKTLKENELISKQDIKDITSWSGIRNYAAHGEWENVNDKQRISLMLEGINLFMRKYQK